MGSGGYPGGGVRDLEFRVRFAEFEGKYWVSERILLGRLGGEFT